MYYPLCSLCIWCYWTLQVRWQNISVQIQITEHFLLRGRFTREGCPLLLMIMLCLIKVSQDGLRSLLNALDPILNSLWQCFRWKKFIVVRHSRFIDKSLNVLHLITIRWWRINFLTCDELPLLYFFVKYFCVTSLYVFLLWVIRRLFTELSPLQMWADNFLYDFPV